LLVTRGEGFKTHAAARDSPFLVGLEHQGADEANDGIVVREDADDVGAALDFAVHAFERVGQAIWARCSRGKYM
jgi:hypothetical protein